MTIKYKGVAKGADTVALKFNRLHVEWNPTTVAALLAFAHRWVKLIKAREKESGGAAPVASNGTASCNRSLTPSFPPGTRRSSEGTEFQEMASLHARTQAFVTSWPCSAEYARHEHRCSESTDFVLYL